eukprot:203234-Pyramimonas_sp.AAC.1
MAHGRGARLHRCRTGRIQGTEEREVRITITSSKLDFSKLAPARPDSQRAAQLGLAILGARMPRQLLGECHDAVQVEGALQVAELEIDETEYLLDLE